MRRTHRSDSTQDEIVQALRACGCSVVSLTSIGSGVPDLLVGYRRETWIMEVKAPDGTLRPSQQEFAKKWRGGDVLIVRSPKEALAALGLVHDGDRRDEMAWSRPAG